MGPSVDQMSGPSLRVRPKRLFPAGNRALPSDTSPSSGSSTAAMRSQCARSAAAFVTWPRVPCVPHLRTLVRDQNATQRTVTVGFRV
jgi:hypothetical protein